jgi:hypothetical protein
MLRAAFNFAHCPKSPSVANGAVPVDWWTTSGYNPLGDQVNLTGIDQDGFLSPTTGSLSSTVVAFQLAGKLGLNPGKLTFAFRLRINVANGGSHSIIQVTTPGSESNVAFYLLLASSTTYPWLAAGGTPYVELTYDILNNKVNGFVNGTPIPEYTPPAPSAAIKTAMLNGTAVVNFRLTSTVNARYSVKDILVIDDLPGDGITGPIGPQVLLPIYTDSVVATDYVKSDEAKTPLQILNTPLPTLATLTSPANKNPLTASLKADIPAGARLNGVILNMAGRGLGDAPSPVVVEVSQGGTTLPVKQVNVPTTMTYGIQMAALTKAPDGTPWSAAKLDATTIKLTPDTTI